MAMGATRRMTDLFCAVQDKATLPPLGLGIEEGIEVTRTCLLGSLDPMLSVLRFDFALPEKSML